MPSPLETGPLDFSDWLYERGNARPSGWLVVGEVTHTTGAHLSIFSYLLASDRLASQLAAQRSSVDGSDAGREIVDAYLDGRAYGASAVGIRGEDTTALPGGETDGPVGPGKRPFIVESYYHGYRTRDIQLVQAFTLFWNAWWSGDTLYRLDADGTPHDVARVVRTEGSVRLEVDLHHLRGFLAMTNAGLLRIHDHTRFSLTSIAAEFSDTYVDRSGSFEFYAANVDIGLSYASFGRVMGKDVVLPYSGAKGDPREIRQGYESFIIGRNTDGTERVASADPSVSDAPYLAPTYFRPELLRRYYDAPDRYRVEAGAITCLDLWAIPFERRPSDDLIQVYLGDLGHIPHIDQRHWRSFNIAPPGTGISEVRFRRDFDAEWVNPEGDVVFDFKQALSSLNTAATEVLGSPLFRDLAERDRHVFANFRVPVSDGPEESDLQITGLAKITVDSVDSDLVKRHLPLGTATANLRSIALLQKLLESWGASDINSIIENFGALYAVRSTGAAHRRGSGEEKALTRAGLLDLGNKELVAELTRRLTNSILQLQLQIEHHRNNPA